MKASDWRAQIAQALNEKWPDFPFDPKWVEAQVNAESGGNPQAVSPAGAKGLLQLMPAAAAEVGVTDRLDPEQNLRGGIEYLRRQFEHLSEITSPLDRLFWSFAAYNCGRGFIDFNGGAVNTALELAKADNPTDWYRWDTGKHWLMHATVAGKHPDYQQVWGYVARIQDYHANS